MNIVFYHAVLSRHMRLYVVDVLEMCYGRDIPYLSN